MPKKNIIKKLRGSVNVMLIKKYIKITVINNVMIFIYMLLFSVESPAIVNNSILEKDNLAIQLVNSICNGRYDDAKQLISKGANINYQDEKYGFSPLLYAIRGENLQYDRLMAGEHIDFAIYLINQKANISLVNKYGYSAVHYAAGCLFLKNAMDYNYNESKFYTPYYDSKYGMPQNNKVLDEKYLHLLKILQEKNANFNCKNNVGVLPLHIAALSGSYEVFKYVASHTLELNSSIKNGSNALMIAVEYQSKDTYSENMKMIKFLLERGVDVNGKISNFYYETTYYLNEAIRLGYPETVELLLKKGSNPNCQRISYPQGSSDEVYSDVPLNSIAGVNVPDKIKIAELLLRYKANINYVDSFGWNALDYAIVNNDYEYVKYLLKNGIDIKSKTVVGQKKYGISEGNLSALELAANVLEMLLQKKIDLDIEYKMTVLGNVDNIKSKISIQEYNNLKEYFDAKGYCRDVEEIKDEIDSVERNIINAKKIHIILETKK
ncbi:MAG TPA: ankyrin repeat domain-containing protein [Spirochaetota bacterium]|nr:ankyrin repeat domain-containing protein [Spirochaetota bacterium]